MPFAPSSVLLLLVRLDQGPVRHRPPLQPGGGDDGGRGDKPGDGVPGRDPPLVEGLAGRSPTVVSTAKAVVSLFQGEGHALLTLFGYF